VLDDTTRDKPYARVVRLVTRHWPGRHWAVVQGINLITVLWTDSDAHWPCDFQIYDTRNGLTKRDHFRAMLDRAAHRGSQPTLVGFDSRYASLDNLTRVRQYGVYLAWIATLPRRALMTIMNTKPVQSL
jgi:putative transposase